MPAKVTPMLLVLVPVLPATVSSPKLASWPVPSGLTQPRSTSTSIKAVEGLKACQVSCTSLTSMYTVPSGFRIWVKA